MKRTPWADIVATPASRYLLIGTLDDSFGGGPGGGYDSDRLRFAVNLMKRCCTGLSLQGTLAVQASRSDAQPQVQISTDDQADFQRLTLITSGTQIAETPWKGQCQFVLDEAMHQQLLEIAGEPDNRGAGRRERERRVAEVEDRILRWKVSDHYRPG